MGTLALLSKEATSDWLSLSEYALLGFALIVVIGLVGEHKRAWPHPRYELFAILVAIGCAGEMVADGGVFFFSRHLQAISDAELARVTVDVGNTRSAADKAANAASRAASFSGQAEGHATNALALARGARQEADSFKNEISSARKQAAEAESHLAEVVNRAKDIEQRIAWRTLSLGQRQRVAEKLRPFSGQKFSIIELPDDLEIEGIGDDVLTTLVGPNGAGWNRLVLQRIPDPQRRLVSGIFVDLRRDADQRSIRAASALSLALNKEGIKTSPPHSESGPWSVSGGVFNSRTGSFQDLVDSPILLVIGKKPRPE